jgi:N-acetylmuramoyl-L-alanine amidase
VAQIGFFRAWALVAATALVALLLAAAAFISNSNAQATTSPVYAQTVVIDPGHGGTDAGARFVGSKYGLDYVLLEKDQNLDVSYRLKALLEASGATVYMTRTKDVYLSNNDRYTYANSVPSADVLVSVHMNSATSDTTDYATTLFGKWRKDKELAYAVWGGLKTLPAANGAGYIRARDPYSFASGVLLKSNMPATIAEAVFISSRDEGPLLYAGRNDLSESSRQQQIALALHKGVEDYFSP